MAGSRILRAILKAATQVGERPATRRAVAEATERSAAREAAEVSRSPVKSQWFDTAEEMDEAIDTAIRSKALEGRIIRESEQLSRGRPREIAPSWENKAGRTHDKVWEANLERMKELEQRGGPSGGTLNQALVDISRKHRGDLRATAKEFEQLLDTQLSSAKKRNPTYEETGINLRKLRELTKTKE